MNRRGPLSKLIGGSIGLAQEYRAGQKRQKESKATGSEQATSSNVDDSTGVESEDEDNEQDVLLSLDELQQLEDGNSGNGDQQDVDQLLESFFARHPALPATPQQPMGNLTLPVILPQRRPESRHRGFIKAYAPVLMDCGIDQATWLDFLHGFEKSIDKHSWFHVTNAAAAIAGHVHMAVAGVSVIATLVTLALHVSIEAGRRTYIHYETNKYLDTMNDKFFKPRGLFCLVCEYKPSSEQPTGEVNLEQSIGETVEKRDAQSKWKGLFSGSATKTKDADMPEPAPLVFPQLDSMNDAQKQNAVKQFGSFMGDYFDRQSAAKFSAQNPDSKIPVAPQQEFASRYSDPNHPASQGGLVSIATGGAYNPTGPTQRILQRHNQRRQERGARPIGKEARKERKQNRPLRKFLKEGVLYLMVVNMPSQGEIDQATAALEQMFADGSLDTAAAQ